MKNRLIVRSLPVSVGITLALWVAGANPGHAQTCPSGQVCNPLPCGFGDGGSPVPLQLTGDCTTETATFTPDMDTWTYVFDPNNAIKISTDVTCPFFELKVDRIVIDQNGYKARRDVAFADTVCNPTAGDGIHCVFYRLHGELVPKNCYPVGTPDIVQYSIFWNSPPIQGNKHDWMLLRAPCDEFMFDTMHPHCFENPPFSDNVTVMVERKPPVGTDPVVRGSGDGISDFIVAISTRHPHAGIPPTPF